MFRTRLLTLALLMSLFAPSVALAQSSPKIVPMATPETATPAPATTACDAPAGKLVVAPTGGIASPNSPGLVVLDAATGKQIGGVKIPLVTEVIRTNLPDHLIARTGTDLFVVDVDKREAIRLDFGDPKPSDLLANYIQTRGTAGKRFFLLGDGAMGQAFAVDLQTGVATDLVKLISAIPGSSKYAGYVAVSPDDARIVLWDGGHTYLIDTSGMTAERIGGDGFTFGPAFNFDGSELIYSRKLAENAGSELVVHPMGGSAERVIHSSPRVAITLPVPGRNALLVDDRSQSAPGGNLALLDLGTGETRKLIDYAGSVLSIQFSANGDKAIAGIDDVNGRAWTLIDLASGASQVVAGAAESNALPGLYGNADWATFTPLDIMGAATAGGFYGGMSLFTGEFHKYFDAKSNTAYATPLLSPNGRWALLQATRKPDSDLWLLDNGAGAATKIATSLMTTGQFSPDGCWFALTKTTNVDGLRTTELSLIATSGEANEIPLGSGRALAWLS